MKTVGDDRIDASKKLLLKAMKSILHGEDVAGSKELFLALSHAQECMDLASYFDGFRRIMFCIMPPKEHGKFLLDRLFEMSKLAAFGGGQKDRRKVVRMFSARIEQVVKAAHPEAAAKAGI